MHSSNLQFAICNLQFFSRSIRSPTSSPQEKHRSALIQPTTQPLNEIDTRNALWNPLPISSRRPQKPCAVRKIEIALNKHLLERGTTMRLHKHFIVRRRDMTLLRPFEHFSTRLIASSMVTGSMGMPRREMRNMEAIFNLHFQFSILHRVPIHAIAIRKKGEENQ